MSADFGLKVSRIGAEVTTAPLTDLIIDDIYPFPKCDLRINPKNYGIINFTVASVPADSGGIPGQVQIYQQAHTYTYIPDFLVAWNYPTGTDPSNTFNSNSIFGIGDIDATLDLGVLIVSYTDDTNFNVVALNIQTTPLTNIAGSIRFYIFADDFQDSP